MAQVPLRHLKCLNGTNICKLTGTKTAELWGKEKRRKHEYFGPKNYHLYPSTDRHDAVMLT